MSRIVLPSGFANATLIVEIVSDVEIRIRKAEPSEGSAIFREEASTVFNDQDRDFFLHLHDNPPAPNDALQRAARADAARRG